MQGMPMSVVRIPQDKPAITKTEAERHITAGHVARLKEGAAAWNAWKQANPDLVVDLSQCSLSGLNLSQFDLRQANLSQSNLFQTDLRSAILEEADFRGSDCRHADLRRLANCPPTDIRRAKLHHADFRFAVFGGASLQGATGRETQFEGARLEDTDLINADFAGCEFQDVTFSGSVMLGVDLHDADLREAKLQRVVAASANLANADCSEADFSAADLRGANLSGAILRRANLSGIYVEDVRWDARAMRGRFKGIQGIDSCYGDAFFKRAASDQDFLDSLEERWKGTWRRHVFTAWSLIDYGRSLARVLLIALALIVIYGSIYAEWPSLLGLDCRAQPCADGQQLPRSSFTPFYFSIVTYTTLGFGDVTPKSLPGELIVSSEVIVGYMTLGLLLSVLAEKVARRS